MESAIHDLVRELDEHGRPRVPELEVELQMDEDEMLLDPWFFKTEEEIAAIEDDPTAKIIEIKIESYGTGLEDSRWAF